MLEFFLSHETSLLATFTAEVVFFFFFALYYLRFYCIWRLIFTVGPIVSFLYYFFFAATGSYKCFIFFQARDSLSTVFWLAFDGSSKPGAKGPSLSNNIGQFFYRQVKTLSLFLCIPYYFWRKFTSWSQFDDDLSKVAKAKRHAIGMIKESNIFLSFPTPFASHWALAVLCFYCFSTLNQYAIHFWSVSVYFTGVTLINSFCRKKLGLGDIQSSSLQQLLGSIFLDSLWAGA